MTHINPDHFLNTDQGRVISKERNALAWHLAFTLLKQALADSSVSTKLYIMIGCQASGKSTWARQKNQEEPQVIIFDAILVKKAERQPVIALAQQFHIPIIAIWLNTPLNICLTRNAARPADEQVNEQGLRNVFAALEPPMYVEGFLDIKEVFT